MWQCIAQSPGSSATNSRVRVLPVGTSTVVSGQLCRLRDPPAVGLGDAERVTVKVDRVVIHRAEVADPDAHALAGLRDQRRRPGKAFAFIVSTLNSVISFGLGRFAPGSMRHSCSMIAKSRSMRWRGSPRVDDEHAGHPERHLRHLVMMRVIHGRCRVWRSVNSYLNVSPGAIGFWVRPPTPSIPFGTRTPCQCTVVAAGSWLVT